MLLLRGGVVGRVEAVARHPNADLLYLAFVKLDVDDTPRQIVFGGDRPVHVDDLVPVAPPGARLRSTGWRRGRVRSRVLRGLVSEGVLCSFVELGWLVTGPDRVAVLRNVTLGESLDEISPVRRALLTLEVD